MIDVNYCVDIDTLVDFDLAERAIEQKQLDIDVPRPRQRAGRARLAAIRSNWWYSTSTACSPIIACYVFEDGREAVACSRGDGMGLAMLRDTGLPLAVLSTEKNPVVDARCRKLGMECRHGLADKRAALVATGAREKCGS